MWKYIFRCANFAVAVLPLTMKLNKLLVLAGNVGRALIKTFNTTAQHRSDEFPFHPKKPKRHCLFVRTLRNHHYLCKLFGKWDDGFMSNCMHVIFHADWGSNSILINCERFMWILCAWPRTQKDNHFLSAPKSADNEPFCERWNRVKITMLPPKPKYGIQNMLAHPVWLTSLSHILWLYQIRKSIKSAACFHSQKFLSRARKERQKWACWNAYHTLIQILFVGFFVCAEKSTIAN